MEKSKEKTKNRTAYYDKKPDLGNESSFKLREHFKQGMTIFVVVAACIVCYFAILRFDYISNLVGIIVELLRPIIYGVAIAYLLNPIVKTTEKYTVPFLKKYIKKENAVFKICRTIGIFTALAIMIAVVSALLNMVVPELIKSIMDLVNNLPGQVSKWIDWVEQLQEGDTFVNKTARTALLQGSAALEKWVQTDFIGSVDVLMTEVTSGVISVVNGVLDIIIGIIVSIYALYSKEQFLGQSRKIIYALSSPKRANLILHILRRSNDIFGGFIIGKIIDSAIIGVLCFLGVSLLNMPYALLVSVFVGVTNIIPYFGPFIGAIPSAILIMIVDPLKGLYFVIFILLLQQLDGNIIGPTILGDSTGLSAFWVLFAILLFGGLFGVVGMIIGVPTFAVFYYIIEMFISHKLKSRNLPIETACYYEGNYVDNEGNYIANKSEISDNETIEAEKGE